MSAHHYSRDPRIPVVLVEITNYVWSPGKSGCNRAPSDSFAQSLELVGPVYVEWLCVNIFDFIASKEAAVEGKVSVVPQHEDGIVRYVSEGSEGSPRGQAWF